MSILATISGAFTFIIEHSYFWALKLIMVAILLALWAQYVDPYAEGIKIYILWFANQTVFKLFSYELCMTITQIVVMLSTLKLFLWITHHNKSTP